MFVFIFGYACYEFKLRFIWHIFKPLIDIVVFYIYTTLVLLYLLFSITEISVQSIVISSLEKVYLSKKTTTILIFIDLHDNDYHQLFKWNTINSLFYDF